MNTATRLGVYGVALAMIGVGAYAVGTGIGPTPAVAQSDTHGSDGHGSDTHGSDAHGAGDHGPGGLASSAGGYTLSPADPMLDLGQADQFSFVVTGPDGTPVTGFDVEHDKRMHLIVVRRDGFGFQHVHPEMSPDGTWTAPLRIVTGGAYRAFADFVPTGGDPTTLGVDLFAAGEFTPVTPRVSRVAQVDGYRVELRGDLTAGGASTLTVAVSRDGRPVTDLQPYLAAYGHLVALRQGDLAYLHVHPEGSPGDGSTAAGPDIEFVAEVPSAGTYQLYLDFQHDGVVRTAAFTLATDGAVAPVDGGHGGAGHGGDGHSHGGDGS